MFSLLALDVELPLLVLWVKLALHDLITFLRNVPLVLIAMFIGPEFIRAVTAISSSVGTPFLEFHLIYIAFIDTAVHYITMAYDIYSSRAS